MNVVATNNFNNLIAGDYPLKAEEITIKAPFKLGDVVAFDKDGNIKLAGASDKVSGIIPRDIDASPEKPKVITMFIKGEFNESRLRFAEGTDIEKHRRRMVEIGLLTRVVN